MQPTHRHKKRGTEYVLLGYGKIQAENWVIRPKATTPVDSGWPVRGDRALYRGRVMAMTPKFVPIKQRVFVSLFPNSNALGLNVIAYGLMGGRSGPGFGLFYRATKRAKFTPRPRRLPVRR